MYEMKVTGRFRDPMTRQVNEAVKISKAFRSHQELLNERKEFNILRLVALSAEDEE